MIGETMLSEEEVNKITASLRGALEEAKDEIKTLRRSMKYARKRAESAEADAEKQRQDKLRYKDFCVRIFTNTVDFHAEGKTISVPWLIKEYTKLFNSVQPFYWG